MLPPGYCACELCLVCSQGRSACLCVGFQMPGVQVLSVVRGLVGGGNSWLACAFKCKFVGAVIYVVHGDLWPMLLSPCNTGRGHKRGTHL